MKTGGSFGAYREDHPAGWLASALGSWLLLYFLVLPRITDLGPTIIGPGPLADAVSFFIYEVPKVLLLLIAVVFGVGLLRTFVSPQQAREWLKLRQPLTGHGLAALLGVITPFCSCSAVPLFVGFVQSGIPLGVTFSFLIAAPMVNEVAVVMLFTFFGTKVAAAYLLAGVSLAIGCGYAIGKLELDNYLEEWVRELRAAAPEAATSPSPSARLHEAVESVRDIVGRVWLYIVIGIAVGATIHGYIPTGFFSQIMGDQHWWSVPIAVLIGIPMYSNAAGIFPVAQALLEKGAALGTTLAFMMSVIGLSLPELIILKKVLKLPLILVFVGTLAVGIIAIGFIFNFFFHGVHL
ncbi:MAG: permease [Oligoflexia bacterium]|nr:permease [Oligoflexia bacterium]